MTTLFFGDEPITLDNGISGIPWQVETANPPSFHALISGGAAATPPAIIRAQLFLPAGARRCPIVIIVPGSLGVAPSHLYNAELLTDAGIAACVLDPFGSRGVTSTVSNQAQYSFAASAFDVVATVSQLADRDGIDPMRIGAQGHSRGGSAVLSAACLLPLLGRGQLAGVYAAYPWCGQQFLNPHIGATKVRSVVGDRDEWCLPQQVQGYMQAMRLTGGDATWRIFAGAHHSFDRDTAVELVADASVAPGAPTIYIADDGAMVHPATGLPDPALSERDAMLYGIRAGYGVRGARIGSSGTQAKDFHDDMMAFWHRCLA